MISTVLMGQQIKAVGGNSQNKCRVELELSLFCSENQTFTAGSGPTEPPQAAQRSSDTLQLSVSAG